MSLPVIGSLVYSPISIKVEKLWVVKGGGLFTSPKAILQDISFDVAPGSFVAVVGPNGAGKTTMFNALVGDKPYAGQILFSQDSAANKQYESLYDNPEYWLQQIGYVPVDNVLHEDLTVRQALLHLGRLRMPGVSDAEIESRILDRLERLGFNAHDVRLDQLVKTLSSGERKKVNISAELLADPPLLLLDEPTSNLDPNAERDLMDNLKRISGQQNNGNGPTILLITHTLASIDRCDHVVFIANSKLLRQGSPSEVYSFLLGSVEAKDRPAESENTFEQWATIFDFHKTLESGSHRETVALPKLHPYPTVPRRDLRPDSFWRQFRILLSRYFLARYNDLGGIFTIFFSGFIAGFLLLIAPDKVFLKATDASAARQTVVLFVILVAITGAFNSHREISKEFRIYIHERAKGLNPLAYLVSKVVWLAVVLGFIVSLIILALTGMPISRLLVLVAAIILFVVGVIGFLKNRKAVEKLKRTQIIWRIVQLALIVSPLVLASFIQLQNKELPDTPIQASSVELAVIVTLTLCCVAALVTGIMVSSLVGGNNDRATQLVIAVIIANVILAFSVLVLSSPEFRGLFQTLEPFTVTHWGYSGFSSSLNIYCWAGSLRFDDFDSIGHLASTWIYLVLHIIGTIALSVVALRLQETWVSRRRVALSLVRDKWTWVYALVFIFLLNWAVFLSAQSTQYYNLTFFDELYGGNRYADITAISNANYFQQLNGQVSQSACSLGSGSDETSLPLTVAEAAKKG